MFRALLLRLAPLLLCTLPGCFKDSTPMQSCADGLAGCPCRPDETCDPGLECRAPGVCIELNCTPGARDCVCDDGSCEAGSVCNDLGACVEPPPPTTDSGTTATSSDVTSSGQTTRASAEGTGSSGTPTTSTSVTTTGPVDCDACLFDAHAVCTGMGLACSMGCEGAIDCVIQCGPDETCALECCIAADFETRMFFGCLADECAGCPGLDACKAR